MNKTKALSRRELEEHIQSKKSVLCVGLDPQWERIPQVLRQTQDPLYQFCRAIIDATHTHAVAFKPNLAFFEARGVQGWESLRKVILYLREHYPQHFTIADAKRGDIGNTARQYAQAFFQELGFDSLTVAPYMGSDSVEPFLESGHWAILLALTSNQGAEDFQLVDLQSPQTERKEKLYQHVLTLSQRWGTADQLMYVVGATRPDQLRKIRSIVPQHFLLVPGVGAQGGSVEDVLRHGWGASSPSLLINASRSIIFASSGADFAEAAQREAQRLQEKMLPFFS